MAKKAKKPDNPPPVTKILSVTPPFEIDEGEERTSSKPEFAEPPESVPQVAPEFEEPETEEPSSEQPLTEEELNEEPTGDRVKDAQRAYHKLTKQVKEQGELIHALTIDKQMRPMPAPTPSLPPETLSPEPIGDEVFGVDPNFPAKYMRRQQGLMMAGLQQRDTEREMREFVDRTSNWREMVPIMQEIASEDPQAYQGPGSLSRLHNRAKDQRELKQLRENAARVKEEALQAGIKMGQQARGRAFVSPGAAGAAMPGKVTVPADFATWPTAKQAQWLVDNNLMEPTSH